MVVTLVGSGERKRCHIIHIVTAESTASNCYLIARLDVGVEAFNSLCIVAVLCPISTVVWGVSDNMPGLWDWGVLISWIHHCIGALDTLLSSHFPCHSHHLLSFGFVIINNSINDPPREQWLARLDVGARSSLSLFIRQPSHLLLKTHPQAVAREAGVVVSLLYLNLQKQH
jgi:hypothetical protein